LTQLIVQPDGDLRLGRYLNAHLQDPQWTGFSAAVAFVKYSGVRQIERSLREFSDRAAIRFAVGVDCQGSSVEGLTALLNATRPNGAISVFHNENDSTFHPKIYIFSNATAAEVVIGSGNLTAGGLYTNYEASVALRLEFDDPAELEVFRQLEGIIQRWTDPASGTSRRLNDQLLQGLAANGYIVTEAQQRGDAEEDRRRIIRPGRTSDARDLFARVRVQPPPIVGPRRTRRGRMAAPVIAPAVRATYRGFVMILQQTDAGHGQTRRGTSRRSPEIFIPLAARDFAPAFWGWQQQFVEDPDKPGKWDRRGVRMRVSTEIVEVNMMTWPVKHDFRLRNERLRSAGKVGDIIRLEKVERARAYDYYAEVIPKESTEYEYYHALCTENVRNSKKRWGYYL
jgi:HKD family nuclease